MNEAEEQGQGQESKRKLLARYPNTRRLLIGMMVMMAVASGYLLWHASPSATMKRTLANCGLAKIPVVRTKYKISRLREETLQSDNDGTYVRFCAEPKTIAEFVAQSASLRNGPVETFEDADRAAHAYYFWPPWFRPNLIKRGRLYVINAETASVKVFIDDERNVVYIAITSPRVSLIDRFRELLN
jgi:hypothetical protein